MVLAVAAALAVGVGAGFWLGSHGPAKQAATEAGKGRRILYYRNPMGLPDTSPVPKKDPMGMDYIPVYEGEEQAAATPAGQVSIAPEKLQKLGVRTEAAAVRVLDRVVRAAGRVEIDERRQHVVAPRFEGWVERLHVDVTGQVVARGQALFDVYSPELVSAQREYALAAQGLAALQAADPQAREGLTQLAQASLGGLRNWEVPESELRALAQTGQTRRTLTLRSPVTGVVLEKNVVAGMRFMPGEPLFRIADLSRVWVVADVFEQDIGRLGVGTPVAITIDAFPGERFAGTVSYVYPTLDRATRTIPIRVELANPGGRLRPGMFAQVEIRAAAQPVLAVPASAVIDSGLRQVVLVETGEGRFQPRTVQLGERGDDYVAVRDGLREGEKVVVAANFLIDAESNLKAALNAFAPQAGADKTALAVTHRGRGRIEAIEADGLTLAHEAIPSLKWPAMTMAFPLADSALARNLKPGEQVSFELKERGPGEYVITRIEPVGGAH